MSAPAINDDRVWPTDTGYKVPTDSGDWFADEDGGVWRVRSPYGRLPDEYRTASEALAVPLGGQPT